MATFAARTLSFDHSPLSNQHLATRTGLDVDIGMSADVHFPSFHQQSATKTAVQHEGTDAAGSIDITHLETQRELLHGGNWIVQKFGGTSLGKFAVKIAEDIVLPSIKKHNIAIVCSARSSKTKSEGTTNRLLCAARGILISDSRKYVDVVEAMRTDHILIGRETIKDKEILKRYTTNVDRECYNLLKILESARLLKAVTPQTEDMVVSVGEKLSCLLMTSLLRSKGINAIYVDLSDIVDSNSLSPQGEGFYRHISHSIGQKIHEFDLGAVPVITGFFGKVSGGLLNQVGRGYTDLCAALTAVGLSAQELQIWKEVDGIFTADPGKVPNACLLDSVTPAEAAELTFYGSEVIHPFTMGQVIRESIPVRIKNVKNARSSGTVIFSKPSDNMSARPLGESRNRSAYASAGQMPRRPTAVSVKLHITVINIHSKRKTRTNGFLTSIFAILDENGLSVDLVSSSEVNISMAIHSENALLSVHGEDDLRIQSYALQRAIDSLKTWGDVDIVPNLAILSLVGQQLRSMVGVSGRFFSTLGEYGINIEMISQGASEISISCVIEERDADRALSVVHANLFAFLD